MRSLKAIPPCSLRLMRASTTLSSPRRRQVVNHLEPRPSLALPSALRAFSSHSAAFFRFSSPIYSLENVGGLKPEFAKLKDGNNYPELTLFENKRTTFFHVLTSFCVVNSAFWTTFYDLGDQYLSGMMLTSLPYMSVILFVIPWVVRWYYARSFILEFKLRRGWRDLDVKVMGMTGPVQAKIDLYKIPKLTMVKNEEQYIFKVPGSLFFYLLDYKRGQVSHEHMLVDILNGKPPLPPPLDVAKGSLPLEMSQYPLSDGKYAQGKVKDGIYISKPKI